jgi:nucleotide-binding universal stress UspA family protein
MWSWLAHPLGIAIASVSVLSLAAVAVWLVRSRSSLQPDVAKTVRDVSAVRRILVPVRGSGYNDRAVELACRLGEQQKAEIIACHVIEVPLALPLSTPLPKEEERAVEILERARELIAHHGLAPKTLSVREREVARGVLRVAEEHGVDMVVLGINPQKLAAGESVGKATEALLRKSHIEVIVDMHPEDENEPAQG